jgi:hypothetical protein
VTSERLRIWLGKHRYFAGRRHLLNRNCTSVRHPSTVPPLPHGGGVDILIIALFEQARIWGIRYVQRHDGNIPRARVYSLTCAVELCFKLFITSEGLETCGMGGFEWSSAVIEKFSGAWKKYSIVR